MSKNKKDPLAWLKPPKKKSNKKRALGIAIISAIVAATGAAFIKGEPK